MRCLYCGQQLKLLKRLTGGDFCSAEHRRLFEGHFSEGALNRLLKEEPVDVPDSHPATESTAVEGSDAPKAPQSIAPESADLEKDTEEVHGSTQTRPVEPAPSSWAQPASESAADPDTEASIWKNPDDRPVLSTPEEPDKGPNVRHDGPRETSGNRTPMRMTVPFVEYAPSTAAETGTAVQRHSRTNVLVPDEILMEAEPVERAKPIWEPTSQGAAPARALAATLPPKSDLQPESVSQEPALQMDFACQSGMDSQRLVLFTADLDRLAERLTAAQEMQILVSEVAVLAAPDTGLDTDLEPDPELDAEPEPASGGAFAAPDDSKSVAEPEQNRDSHPNETEATSEGTAEGTAEAEDDEWLQREWRESTLLPVPWPNGAIQDWRPSTPRCAGFPSRDPEFSIFQPTFEAPPLSDIGKVPELVTEMAAWQGHADPGQSIEIHWRDAPLGKPSTECVAGSAVRLAFHAIGLEGRGSGPLPVRPISPIGLPQKLTPPPDGSKEVADDAAIQGPRKELSRRPATPLQESETDVDQVEAKLQSLTALARSTRRPAAEPTNPVVPTAGMPDKDEGQVNELVPPPAVTTPLPVTLLGSAAPRRRPTVVFPIGIPAALGPVISIPASVPIREVIYLLSGASDEQGDEQGTNIEDVLNDFDWAHPDSFFDPEMHSAPHEAEAVDTIEPVEVSEPFDAKMPSALDDEFQAETDEQENQPEITPQEGPEHV